MAEAEVHSGCSEDPSCPIVPGVQAAVVQAVQAVQERLLMDLAVSL